MTSVYWLMWRKLHETLNHISINYYYKCTIINKHSNITPPPPLFLQMNLTHLLSRACHTVGNTSEPRSEPCASCSQYQKSANKGGKQTNDLFLWKLWLVLSKFLIETWLIRLKPTWLLSLFDVNPRGSRHQHFSIFRIIKTHTTHIRCKMFSVYIDVKMLH